MIWNFLKLPKNRNRNLSPSYGGARRERVLRGRVALIAGASSQRLPLSRLLWVLSCSKKVPRRRHRTRTRKSLRLRLIALILERKVCGRFVSRNRARKDCDFSTPLRCARNETLFFKHQFVCLSHRGYSSGIAALSWASSQRFRSSPPA